MLVGLLFTVLAAAEPIAYLMQGKGNMQIMRANKAIKYKSGEMLFNNDEIKTGGESFAAIKYLDGGATIKVFPNSIIKLSAIKQGKALDKSTSITKGGLYSKVNSKIKGGFQVETPTTVASVKGTGFLTKYDIADKRTIINVLEGVVEVQHKESGKTTQSAAGSTTVSSADGEVDTQPSQAGDVSEKEMEQIEATNQQAQKTLKIQVTDDKGNLKYIEITY